jgi:hypothetical protein
MLSAVQGFVGQPVSQDKKKVSPFDFGSLSQIPFRFWRYDCNKPRKFTEEDCPG